MEGGIVGTRLLRMYLLPLPTYSTDREQLLHSQLQTRLPKPRYLKGLEEVCQGNEAPQCKSSLPPKNWIPLISMQEVIPPSTNFNKQFLDLLRRIFVYDPSKRITAPEALKHPWFKETLTDDGTEAARIRMKREMVTREPVDLDYYDDEE